MFSNSRREFLSTAGAVSMMPLAAGQSSSIVPWYRRAYRWSKTNITEKDPVRYDIGWWREYWKRTQVQAVIIKAGGIVAYYRSKFPLHYRAEEFIPVGPVQVKIHLPEGVTGRSARLLVAGGRRPVSVQQGVASLDLASIKDHEVIVLE